MILVSFVADSANVVLDNLIYTKERCDNVTLYLPRQFGVINRASFLCVRENKRRYFQYDW